MAIIVDKEKKRREIALSSRELLLKVGIKNITVAEISKTAGVGKGTIYEYFSNKEDIVFEIIAIYMDEHAKVLSEISSSNEEIKEKLKSFMLLLFNSENSEQELMIYREFIAIALTSHIKEMSDFAKSCKSKIANILRDMLQSHVQSGDISALSLEFVDPILYFLKGVVVEQGMTQIEAKQEVLNFIESWFTLIRVDKQ
jgi:TetR/AcrR family transcriptional regulator, acrAB operon repressor